MQPPLCVLVAVLAVLAPACAAPAADGMEGSVIAVTQSGVMHLDSEGALLAWRPEQFQWQFWHVATNPRNGTVCWVSVPPGHDMAGVMRCALISNLNATWDLPQPRDFKLNVETDAVAFDWQENNWYLTVWHVSYVCSYMFDKCAQLAKGQTYVRFFTAYDIPNRLMFRLTVDKEDKEPYKLLVFNLDGTGVRELPATFHYPAGLAVDPIKRQILVIDRTDFEFGTEHGLHRVDYNGEGKTLVTRFQRKPRVSRWRRSLDVLDGTAIVMYRDQSVISSVSTSDGKKVVLVNGTVKGQTDPALAHVQNILTVKIFSSASQPETENQCADAACSDICIPTPAGGVTCLCPEGQRLLDLGCRHEYPLYAVVSGGDTLQALDMQTNQVTTILSGLTNVSRADFLWTDGEEELLLFWVDEGSVFRGSWTPGGTISDVRTVHEASETRQALEVVVDWAQRSLLWMERNSTKSSRQITTILAALDGSYQKKIANTRGDQKQAMFVVDFSNAFGYAGATDVYGKLKFETFTMKGDKSYSPIGERYLNSTPIEVAVDLSPSQITWHTRFFWVQAEDESIQLLHQPGLSEDSIQSTLLTHPSLADAGGLDVLDAQLFWTERATGRLWRANSKTGGEVHSLDVVTAGGRLRLLHPWRQPQPEPRVHRCDAERNVCSHFCVTALVDYEWGPLCICPDGMELADDAKTCQ